jgi:hypothetical protein
MAVRRDDRVFDHMAHDLAARQRADIYLLPVGQALTGARLPRPSSSASRMPVKWWLNWRNPSVTYSTATLQSTAKGQPRPHISAQWMARVTSEGTTTAKAPGHPAVVGFASVEIAADRQRPRAQARVDGVGAGQRAGLLDQQSEQDGKETHGAANDSWRFACICASTERSPLHHASMNR